MKPILHQYAASPFSEKLRLVLGLPGRLPDCRFSRALPARCAALHFLSDH